MNITATAEDSLAFRLVAIFAPLAVLVAARFRVLGPWTVPIWTRLTRAGRRLARLLANPPSLPRPRKSRATGTRIGAPPIPLPQARAFLLTHLKHEAALYTQRLERLLTDPQLVADLIARPAALRTLRPFCRLLGVTLPQALRPVRATKPSRPVKPAPAMLPSGPRLGRNLACPPSAPPPRPVLSVPPDGCWCANPASGPYWPFPRGPTRTSPSPP